MTSTGGFNGSCVFALYLQLEVCFFQIAYYDFIIIQYRLQEMLYLIMILYFRHDSGDKLFF